MLIAPELAHLSHAIAPVECAGGEQVLKAELQFEMARNAAGTDLHALMSGRSGRSVNFIWNPDTGELSYDPRAELKLPEDLRAAIPGRTTASCGSR